MMGFPGSSAGKESACHAGHLGSIPRLGRSPGEGNSYPSQYSCLGNPMGRGPWRREWLPTPVFRPGEFHGLYSSWDRKESDATERLTFSHFAFYEETLS